MKKSERDKLRNWTKRPGPIGIYPEELVSLLDYVDRLEEALKALRDDKYLCHASFKHDNEWTVYDHVNEALAEVEK